MLSGSLKTRLAIAGCLAFILAGCGDSASEDPAAGPATTASEPATTAIDEEEAPEEASRCEAVPQELVDAISEGLTAGTGASLRDAQAVKSSDFSKVYFVSAEIDGPGIEGDGEIGTWGTNELGLGGLIYAVGGEAHQFSDWGHGEDTDADLSLDDDGAGESRDCVGG